MCGPHNNGIRRQISILTKANVEISSKTAGMQIMTLMTSTNCPRKVRELILDSDSRFQGSRGRPTGSQGGKMGGPAGSQGFKGRHTGSRGSRVGPTKSKGVNG